MGFGTALTNASTQRLATTTLIHRSLAHTLTFWVFVEEAVRATETTMAFVTMSMTASVSWMNVACATALAQLRW